MQHCGIGGDNIFDSGGGTYVTPSCTNLVTYRWRSDEMAEGYWAYRCTTHAALLDRTLPGLVIEGLTEKEITQ